MKEKKKMKVMQKKEHVKEDMHKKDCKMPKKTCAMPMKKGMRGK